MKQPNVNQVQRTSEVRWHLAQIVVQLVSEKECPEHPDLMATISAVEAEVATDRGHYGPPTWDDLRAVMRGTLKACLEALEDK